MSLLECVVYFQAKMLEEMDEDFGIKNLLEQEFKKFDKVESVFITHRTTECI